MTHKNLTSFLKNTNNKYISNLDGGQNLVFLGTITFEYGFNKFV